MTLYPVEGLNHFWRAQPEEDLAFEELLLEVSARLSGLPADQVDHGIEEALRLVCSSAGIDESTIYLREIENPDIFVLSYVLRDPALPPPPTIKFTAADNFPWCNRKLIANEIIYLPDTQKAPKEAAVDKASWKKYNVVSALVIPLSTGGGRPLGFWGIDSTSQRREWPKRLQKRLRIIAGVFADTIERSVSDRLLRESEARLTLAAETAGVGFWTIDVATHVVWATPKLKELFGFKPDGILDMTVFLAAVHPEDRERVQQGINAMTRGDEIKEEYRILPSGGTMRWVMSRGGRRVFAIDGRSLLMGITFDITERRSSEEALRKLGNRLIQAQEQERKRIARELHDGISQQLALISIGLERLQSDNNLEPADRLKQIQKLSNETVDLASNVHSLSHQLHSSKLDYLGLVPAIRALCREMSEHQQVKIHFIETNLPKSPPPDVALALFRITQESLHNAMKYSGVREFNVRIKGTGTHVELMISDNGRGFDVTEAEGRGLGLISMRERILALEGTLSIQSKAMKGTQVSVRVPLKLAASAA
jgi:PAS domain S-box-containing protein